MRIKDVTGQRFGRLTAIAYFGVKPGRRIGKRAWQCKCDCGREVVVVGESLRSGNTTSCGCSKGGKVTHGATVRGEWSSEYIAWHSMLKRCRNTTSRRFDRYGGRGIQVCDRWIGNGGFEAFLSDMGHRPSPSHSLDRIDNDGNYEPGNCRWATLTEQANNRSSTKTVVFNGEAMKIHELASRTGVRRELIWSRLRRGLTVEEAISIPERGRAMRCP